MSWTRIYRLTLWLLPAALRRKHGTAMEALFARELGRARELGGMHAAIAALAGLWDVARRSAYESVRPGQDVTPGPQPVGANFGGPLMPQLTTRELLRRHAISFAVVFVGLTALLLGLFASHQVPVLGARGASVGTILVVLLLAVPFTAAMTIPMAVLVAILYEFTRLGANGTLTTVGREHGGVRRLVVPVLRAAVGISVLALVVTAQVVPRTNARLAAVLAGDTIQKSDRTMTMGELRAAARDVRSGSGEVALRRAAAYDVEFQKKLALPAACLVMALVGVTVALRVPRGGAVLVVGASCAVFGAHYALMVTGESLADRLVVSPVVGMWGANAFLLALAMLLARSRRPPLAPTTNGGVAIRG